METIIIECFVGNGAGHNKHFRLISDESGYRAGATWPNHDELPTHHLTTVWTWPSAVGIVEVKSTGVLLHDNHHCIIRLLVEYCGFPQDLLVVIS